MLGVVRVTPRLDDYSTTKVKTVTFNRCLLQAVRDLQLHHRIEFLPWHFHFLDEEGKMLQLVSRYFTERGEYALAGGLVLREVLLKSVGIIPMDSRH